MSNDRALCSRIRLHRNYPGMPFDLMDHPENTAQCITRTAGALRVSRQDLGFDLVRLGDVTPNSSQCMEECGYITPVMLGRQHAAALVNAEEGLCIMLGGEEQVLIQALRWGNDLPGAANAAFRVEDALSRSVAFAFDEQLGYLAGDLSMTGTGMQAGLLLHLPLLGREKKITRARELATKAGMALVKAEQLGGAELHWLTNAAALGVTERDTLTALAETADQILAMEHVMWLTMREKPHVQDAIWRGAAVLTNARLLPMEEFCTHWAGLRLGAANGVFDIPLDKVDALLDAAKPAHVCAWRQEDLTGPALDAARADRIRSLLRC